MMIKDKFNKIEQLKLKLDCVYIETINLETNVPVKEYVFKKTGGVCSSLCNNN